MIGTTRESGGTTGVRWESNTGPSEARTWARETIADLTMFNHSKGKSGSNARAAPWEWIITQKAYPCFISLLKINLVENSSF
jgi:hypothetical protein